MSPALLLWLALTAGTPIGEKPSVLRDVGFDQRLGEVVPADITLRDEAGQPVRMGDLYARGRPIVFSLVYYECPMLCTLTLNGQVGALRALSLEPGRDFEVVTVSFEPKEGPKLAAAKKAAYLERYDRPGAREGWHFLTGDAPEIARLTRAVGFRHVWDEATRQWAHPAGIMVITPQGRISHYLYGIEYAPKDLRLALVEASAGRIGSPIDQIVLFCYQYDPATGRYGAAVLRLIRVGAALTLLALVAFWTVMWRRDREPAPADGSANGSPR